MVDARLRGSWLGKVKFDNLSDVAWRVFTGALMWSAEQGTDGRIPHRYLKSLHPDGEQPEALAELVAAEFARIDDEGLELIGWEEPLGQSRAEKVEQYRRNARERQRRHRERNKSDDESSAELRAVTDDSATRDVTRDITRYVGSGLGKGIEEQNAKAISPFCSQHPGGTEESCTGCMNARLRFEHAQLVRKSAATVPGIITAPECEKHPYWAKHDCARCREEAAA